VCYIGACIGIGFLYHYFAPKASCGLNIAWIMLTLVFAAIYTAVSVSPWRSPSAGLLTSGVVFVYSTYLVWAALTSEPYSSCAAVTSTKALQVSVCGATCVYFGARPHLTNTSGTVYAQPAAARHGCPAVGLKRILAANAPWTLGRGVWQAC